MQGQGFGGECLVSEFGVWGSGFRIQDVGFRVEGAGVSA